MSIKENRISRDARDREEAKETGRGRKKIDEGENRGHN